MKNSGMMFIALIVVAFIAVAGVMFMREKKRRDDEEKAKTTATTPALENTHSSPNPPNPPPSTGDDHLVWDAVARLSTYMAKFALAKNCAQSGGPFRIFSLFVFGNPAATASGSAPAAASLRSKRRFASYANSFSPDQNTNANKYRAIGRAVLLAARAGDAGAVVAHASGVYSMIADAARDENGRHVHYSPRAVTPTHLAAIAHSAETAAETQREDVSCAKLRELLTLFMNIISNHLRESALTSEAAQIAADCDIVQKHFTARILAYLCGTDTVLTNEILEKRIAALDTKLCDPAVFGKLADVMGRAESNVARAVFDTAFPAHAPITAFVRVSRSGFW